MIKIEFLRKLDIDELREALAFMEKQTEEKKTDNTGRPIGRAATAGSAALFLFMIALQKDSHKSAINGFFQLLTV